MPRQRGQQNRPFDLALQTRTPGFHRPAHGAFAASRGRPNVRFRDFRGQSWHSLSRTSTVIHKERLFTLTPNVLPAARPPFVTFQRRMPTWLVPSFPIADLWYLFDTMADSLLAHDKFV